MNERTDDLNKFIEDMLVEKKPEKPLKDIGEEEMRILSVVQALKAQKSSSQVPDSYFVSRLERKIGSLLFNSVQGKLPEGFSKKFTLRNLVAAAASIAVILVIAVALFQATNVFDKWPSQVIREEKPMAFGSLPERKEAASVSKAFSLTVPEAMIYPPVEYRYEYEWVGGTFPDFPEKMPVYKQEKASLSFDELRNLVNLFSSSGLPLRGKSAPEDSGTIHSFSYQFKTPDKGRDETSYILSYSGEDGRYYYALNSPEEWVSKNRQNLPSDEEAVGIAINFLRTKGLLPPNAKPIAEKISPDDSVVNIQIGPESETPAPVKPISPLSQIDVYFERSLGGYKLVDDFGQVDRYDIRVSIGPGGKILHVTGFIPTELIKSEYPLRSVSEVFNELKEGKHSPPLYRIMSPGIEPFIAPTPLGQEDSEKPRVTEEPGASPGEMTSIQPVPPITEPVPKTEEPPRVVVQKVRLSHVELAYRKIWDDKLQLFYEPVFIFSGKLISEEGKESDTAIAVRATSANK